MITAPTTRPIERPLDAPPTILGAYRLHERLGAGGQASVYRARRVDDPDGADVALKRLHRHLLDDELAVQSFAREARLAYLVDHPVFRRVFALCRAPGELFIVMEYVSGVALGDLLQRARAAGRRPPVAASLALLHPLCSALHHAHELVDERGAPAGLVHRDVSPSNLLVTPAGRVRLIDLGVVRSASIEHATSSGHVKGKYGYMAPEIMRGEPFDRRADVFSVGVVAWELLTSRRLFPARDGADPERARSRLPVEPPSRRNPGCPAALDAIVLRALAADPADRWPTCAAMAAALREIAVRLGEPCDDAALAALAAAPARPRLARGTASEVRVPVVPPVVTRRRRPRRALAAIGGALAMIVAVTLALGPTAPAPRAAPPAAAPAPRAAAPDAAVPAIPEVAVDPPPVRVAGPEPRSRASTDPYRATVCIDADGRVRSVEIHEGPERLRRRITRALRRWRYRPYPTEADARPVCFEVASRLRRLPRDG